MDERRAPPGDVERAGALARMLDEAFRIPGTDIRIGLDPLIGLVPGVGDVLGGVLSAYVILVAARAGAPGVVLARMVGNVVMDSAVGAVPVLGDLFDAGWKSNTRNVRLLRRHLDEPRAAKRSSAGLVAAALLVLLLVIVGAAALALWVLWMVGRAVRQ